MGNSYWGVTHIKNSINKTWKILKINIISRGKYKTRGL